MFGLGALLTGGGLSLIGNIAKDITDTIRRKQDNAHALEMRKIGLDEKRLDIEAMTKEFEFRDRISAREEETEREISADNLKAESYKHDKATYSKGVKQGKVGGFLLTLVDFVRGLIRPALTVVVVVLVHMILQESREILDAIGIKTFSGHEALEIYRTVIGRVLDLADVVIGWWFGDRMHNKTVRGK